MRRVGQTRRRDANEQAIVDALERVGATVFKLSGPGVPDLLVGYMGKWQPVEVKSKTGRLTPQQAKTKLLTPIPIARTVDEALRLIGIG